MVDIPKPTLRHVNRIFNKVLTIQNKPKNISCFIIIWNDSKTKDKNQINGFFQLDFIALKKFWWKIRTNLGPKTPRKKILIYLSKKYKKLTVD